MAYLFIYLFIIYLFIYLFIYNLFISEIHSPFSKKSEDDLFM